MKSIEIYNIRTDDTELDMNFESYVNMNGFGYDMMCMYIKPKSVWMYMYMCVVYFGGYSGWFYVFIFVYIWNVFRKLCETWHKWWIRTEVDADDVDNVDGTHAL